MSNVVVTLPGNVKIDLPAVGAWWLSGLHNEPADRAIGGMSAIGLHREAEAYSAAARRYSDARAAFEAADATDDRDGVDVFLGQAAPDSERDALRSALQAAAAEMDAAYRPFRAVADAARAAIEAVGYDGAPS